MRKIIMMVFALSLIQAPCFANGQFEQTADGAQEFLEKVLAGMSAETKYYRAEDGTVFEQVKGNVSKYKANGKCGYSLSIAGMMSGHTVTTITTTESSFSNIASAAKTGPTVEVNGKSGTGFLLFTGSEALAARTVYALNFLIQQCDPAAGTGF